MNDSYSLRFSKGTINFCQFPDVRLESPTCEEGFTGRLEPCRVCQPFFIIKGFTHQNTSNFRCISWSFQEVISVSTGFFESSLYNSSQCLTTTGQAWPVMPSEVQYITEICEMYVVLVWLIDECTQFPKQG